MEIDRLKEILKDKLCSHEESITWVNQLKITDPDFTALKSLEVFVEKSDILIEIPSKRFTVKDAPLSINKNSTVFVTASGFFNLEEGNQNLNIAALSIDGRISKYSDLIIGSEGQTQ